MVQLYVMNQKVLGEIRKVHEIFKEKGLTLAIAESCTGGLISHFITALPGASVFFRAGVVSYSEDIKKDMLGVSSDTIDHHGIVSEHTAKEMAERIRFITKSDYSLSSTGNLGPDMLEGKKQGLVYIAACGKGRTFSRELQLTGEREGNKEEAALEALKMIVDFVKDDEKKS
jgi:PncC family amidohydrolase